MLSQYIVFIKIESIETFGKQSLFEIMIIEVDYIAFNWF